MVRRQNGQDLIEFALILPLLLLLLLGIMEFGIAVMRYNTIANAAREGARTGIVRPNDDSAIEAAARALTAGLNQDELDVVITPDSPRTNIVQVEIIYVHHFLTTPVIVAVGGDGTLTLRTVSTMRVE